MSLRAELACENERVNADLSQRACVDTARAAWTGHELVLEAAADRRTSLVQVAAGSTLNVAHRGILDVLVLEGDLGGCIAGTLLHANARDLATERGCRAFVKERPGRVEQARTIDVTRAALLPTDNPGLVIARMIEEDAGDVALLQLAAGATIGPHHHERGEEFFVLRGDFRDEHGAYGPWWWVRQPAGSEHAVASASGCLLFSFAHHLR
jgi:quercetin dioxygenase-like cupin family protein